MIHPTAIISESAKIHPTAKISPFAVVEGETKIGENCEVGANAFIGAGTTLAKGVKIFTGAAIGGISQDLKFNNEESFLQVGENTILREFVTVNRGTEKGSTTQIGKNCLVMSYTHIAHDCKIGNSVILANSVQMGGYVEIDDFAGVGGIVPIHQFVKIGKFAYIGGGYRVPKDVPPFILAAEEPLKFCGLNVVGLRRRGFSREQISELKKIYKTIFSPKLNVQQALEKLQTEPDSNEKQEVLNFIKNSKRGIISG